MSDLLRDFLNSSHGQQALAALQQHGVGPADAQAALGDATAEAQHLVQPGANSGAQVNPLGNFGNAVLGGLGGLLGGGGVGAAIQGGLGGLVAGKVAEQIAKRTGMSPATASTVAAAAAPFLIKFIQERMGGHAAETHPAPPAPSANPPTPPAGPSDQASPAEPTSPWKRML